MSCSFWNMRRKLRQQLGIEREIKEEKVITDIAAAQAEVKKPTTKKAGAKNDKSTSGKS